ncbi:hypothetical protein ABL980_16800 [Pseudomonas aeruginosa]|uniref:HNH endonuclease n=1 Tax=Pseudomonas aeruginosa TaxID=287 RepID=UPI003529570E
MRNSVAPLADIDQNEVQQAINRQRKPRKTNLTSNAALTISKLGNYRTDLHLGNINKINLTKAEHDAYFSLFDSKAAEVSNIKKSVIDLFGSANLCPYCHIDTYKDLDHFFPRSVFPEFSISLQNLVPACSTCNTIYKLALWGNGTGRQFIHPYFDAIPFDEQFLFCNTILLTQRIYKIQFYVKPNPNINPTLTDLFDRHFKSLNLNTRYIAKATSEEVPKIERIISDKLTPDQREAELETFITQQTKANPVNNWTHAFYQSIHPQLENICA